jgi:hypothetical protein
MTRGKKVKGRKRHLLVAAGAYRGAKLSGAMESFVKNLEGSDISG